MIERIVERPVKMTFQETIEFFNGGIESAEGYRCLSKSSSLQIEQCRALDLLQVNATRFKQVSIQRADEDAANLFLAYECAIGAVRSELLMMIFLKRDMPNEAWDQLVAAQMGCMDASRAHQGFAHCQQRLEDLNNYEKLLFPPQSFMSAGFISDGLDCSICNTPYAKCPHLRGKPYMGNFCEIDHRNKRGDHASLVDTPADKRCRVTSVQVREGYMDKLSGEITPYEGDELYDEEEFLLVKATLMAMHRYPYLAYTGRVLGEESLDLVR
jgi:hypothetical protein